MPRPIYRRSSGRTVPLPPMMTITRSNPRKASRTGRSISAVSSSVQPNFRSPICALPSRTQITRHDCVEGWSCIGKWKGVPISEVIERVGLKPAARYLMFYCADLMNVGDPESKYYESIGMDEALHPQPMLAYDMNDKT